MPPAALFFFSVLLSGLNRSEPAFNPALYACQTFSNGIYLVRKAGFQISDIAGQLPQEAYYGHHTYNRGPIQNSLVHGDWGVVKAHRQSLLRIFARHLFR